MPPHLRHCHVCGKDNGCPNVREAESASEVAALEARLRDAEISVSARGCLSILNEFGVAVLNSQAVIARSLSQVHDIVKSDNALYIPFHKQVDSGARLPEQNRFDRGRTAVESAILPNYYREITFGALSLDGRGLAAFGDYTIVLKDQAVALRASVSRRTLLTSRYVTKS